MLLALFLVGLVVGRQSVVSNVDPRRDSTGSIMDIHDGNTIRIGPLFYWYGAGYGPCVEQPTGCANISVGQCGFNLNHTVNLATSKDLKTWHFHGSVLPLENRPAGILFGPWVAQSASTKHFVLWMNILPVKSNGQGDFMNSYYAVATSVSPRGPFVVTNKNVTGLKYKHLPDSPSIFVDTNGKGYIAFTHEDTHINHVQELTPDLMRPLPGGRTSAQIGEPNNEGILMFKRKDLYYVMFGFCCCFCKGGSTLLSYASRDPLGPYELQGTVIDSTTWNAQTGSVWFTGTDYVLFGDRWQSAPDGIKAHDFSYWTPLSFLPNGTVVTIPQFQDTVLIRY